MRIGDQLRRARDVRIGGRCEFLASVSRKAGVAIALMLLLVAGLVAATGFPAHAATADQVELRLWPAGQGRIEVSQNGAAVPVTHNGETLAFCDFVTILDSSECRAEVTIGQPVTLTAIAEPNLTDQEKSALKGLPDFPANNVSFVRWSRAGCGTASACTFTPDSTNNDDWVTALFTPLQLEVGINGQGSVAIEGSGALSCNDNTNPANPDLGFGDTTCHGAFAPDTSLVLDAAPTTPGAAIAWGAGCDPDNGNPDSARCTVTMSNIRTFASVAFAGADPPDFPFQITPRIRVKNTGTGQGRVTGNGIDCGSQCSTDVGYQTRVTLTAQASDGSVFVRWGGVCSTNTTCTFAAGSATYVEARFDAQAPATTTATTTTATTTTTTTTATTTTTSSTTTQRQATLAARLVTLKIVHNRKRRTIVATLGLNQRAHVVLRLSRRRTTIVRRTLTAPPGRSSLRLIVPSATPKGLYLLSLKISSGAQQRVITKSVRLGR